MADEVTTVTEKAPAVAEQVVDKADKVVNKIQAGETTSLLQSLWTEHQGTVMHFGKIILMAILILLIAWIVARICKRLIVKAVEKIPGMDNSIGQILGNLAKTLIWVVALLMILDLLGVNTASILTVLGAAGLAVGLAMKDSLSNISAGLMLLFLRPYKSGDFIDCGTVSGTITEIGLFSTTLKTPDGIFISAPNSSIFGHPIKNFSRNPIRRADITVGIAYGDSIPKALEVLNALMQSNEFVLKDPAPQVVVADLGESSVNLTLRFWATTENYWKAFFGIKESLKGVLEGAGLNIPFPQRVVTLINK